MEQFKTKMIDRGKLNKAGWNYKTDDDVMARKLATNIERNGILQASIIYENPEGELVVLDGNHRLDAYEKLDIKQVPCVNLGQISLNEAKRIAIEVNETRFQSDPFKLAGTIKDILLDFSLEELEVTMPFNVSELEAMAELNDDLSVDDPEPNSRTRFTKEITCPECGNEFEV